MKYVAYILLFASVATAQNNVIEPLIIRYVGPTYATLLDGSTQYWSNTSPANTDLNGSEMITASDDRTFESTVGNWAKAGTVSAAVRSTVDKKSGTASLRATTSGTGDTTSNYIRLDYPNFSSIVSGNKYTLELYARSATAARTITIRVGDATVTSATLSTTFGSFTKVVLNFLATSSTVSKAIYITTSGVIDSLYIDDVSLTQAYDLLIVGSINLSASAPAATANIVQRRKSGGLPLFDFVVDAGVNLRIIFRDTDGLVLTDYTSALAVNDGKWHSVATTVNRLGGAGSLMVYRDGSPSASTVSATTGKVVFSNENLNIGANFTPANYFRGYIGQIQIVKFTALPSDINQILQRISSTWKRSGFPTAYSNGQIVAWYEWRSMGFDKSGSGNHLSSTGSPNIYTVQP